MKKVAVFGVLFSILMIGLYATEVYELCVMLHNVIGSGPFHLSTMFSTLFATYPWWWLLCTIGSAVCGLLAPIMYFCGSTHSIECAYSAFGLDVLLVILNIAFRFRFFSFNIDGWIVSAILSLLTLAFACYLSSQKEDSYTSHSGWGFLGNR